ncbi:MAG: hypothetical protein JRI61_05225 [Deltaproteobacteria bacterium]|nr:hypothetical protein [Deltaproteobacteria bacterium]
MPICRMVGLKEEHVMYTTEFIRLKEKNKNLLKGQFQWILNRQNDTSVGSIHFCKLIKEFGDKVDNTTMAEVEGAMAGKMSVRSNV